MNVETDRAHVNDGPPAFQAYVVTMVTNLIKVVMSLAIATLNVALTDVVEQQRFRAMLHKMRKFDATGKPDVFSTGYVLQSHLSLTKSIEVFENPDVLRAENDDMIVLCLVLIGKEGQSLSKHEIDTAHSFTIDGGVIVRSSDQILPLFAFPGRERRKSNSLKNLRIEIEKTFCGSFGSPSPSLDGTSGTLDDSSTDSKRTPNTSDRVQRLDVMCDRHDKRCAKHFGNRRFAIIVCMFMSKNPNLEDPNVCQEVAKAIIDIIRPEGRFLAKTKRNTWRDIGNELAVRWVSLILKTAVQHALEGDKTGPSSTDAQAGSSSGSASQGERLEGATEDSADMDDEDSNAMNTQADNAGREQGNSSEPTAPNELGGEDMMEDEDVADMEDGDAVGELKRDVDKFNLND